ncbi:MAG: acetate--CoA ligase family protein [Betaproteobacteria bacterium]|nr:acetate--CoA ligase family protein [Betaproteobacteria bacterium]
MDPSTPADPKALARLFRPRSVVLVGASDRSSWSRTAYDNIAAVGFDGKVHLVSRHGGTVHGQAAATSCRAIGEPVDAALLLLPAQALTEALQDVAAAGIRSAVVLTSGFAELGAEGARLQDELAATAMSLGITVLGPNCMGFMNFAAKTALWAGALRAPIFAGKVSIASQSGAIASMIVHLCYQQGVGVGYLISTGNEACLDVGRVIDFLVDDPGTQVIALFSESIRDPISFRHAAERAFAAGKPVVVLKVGRSETTARVAQSHTGALVGDDRIFEAACRQLGIIRVDSIEELVLTADLMSKLGKLRGSGVGLVSFSGGICEIAADCAAAEEISLPAFAEPTVAALHEVLPSYGTPSNPLDITGAVITDTSLFEKTLAIVGKDPALSLLACVFEVPASVPDKQPIYIKLVESIGRGIASAKIPAIMISHTMKPVTDVSRELIAAANLPYVASGVDLGMRAIARAIAWNQKRSRPCIGVAMQPANASTVTSIPASEAEALRHLAAFGVPIVPTVLARTEQEALDAARAFVSSVAMKIASADIAHKSDIGGVVLDVAGEEATLDAYRRIHAAVRQARPDAAVSGIAISPMRRSSLELFVGVKRDPQWGYALAVGLGGVWIEALQDTSLRLLPLDRHEVLEMLGELRAATLLKGYRGMPAVDIELLADVITRIGDAALALGDHLETLEVNPLLARGDKVEALDALVVGKRRSG